jgi:hypothetical protein
MDAEVDRLTRALLYEGYLLYPYRPSSLKNQKRFGIGTLRPRSHLQSRAQNYATRLTAELLLRARTGCSFELTVRFLQLAERLGEGGRREDWDEAIEREIVLVDQRPEELAAERLHRSFKLSACSELGDGAACYSEPLGVDLGLSARHVDPDVFRLELSVENTTPVDPERTDPKIELCSLVSLHVLLSVRGGEFVSLLEPPPELAAAVASSRQGGGFPVLVGDRSARDRVLVSPIVLYDFPEIAPESPGDLFDATEIDEILSLRVRGLTAGEKAQIRDPRGRALLERTEELGPDELFGLHGALRNPEAGRPESVTRNGVKFAAGSRVRLAPSRRADVFDLALSGRQATVRSIEQDFEGRVFLSVTVDDDPGSDLGVQAQPGHRFFFQPDEVEPL